MLPHEKELVERLKDKPFALVGINSDEPKPENPPADAVARAAEKKAREAAFKSQRTIAGAQIVPGPDEAAFIELARVAAKAQLDEQGISWRNAIDGSTSGPWSTRWNTRYWPHIFLIDAKGVIRHVDPPRKAPELDALIEELIAEAEGRPAKERAR
jgi:hypothetical protein